MNYSFSDMNGQEIARRREEWSRFQAEKEAAKQKR